MAQEPDRLTPDSDALDAPDPARLERDIEHTRAEMSETIDALSARFQPSYIKEQAQEAIRDTARSAGTSMIDTIKDNPLPAAIAAMSIAWMFSNRSTSGSSSSSGRHAVARSGPGFDTRGTYAGRRFPSDATGDYAGGTVHTESSADGPSLADRAGDVAGQARDKAADLAGTVSDRAADLGHQAQDAAGRATSWLEDQMDRNPLGVGAVALVAGALVGMSVPVTDAEENFMGQKAAQLVGQVKDVAGEKLDQVKEVASKVADEAKEKAVEVAETVKTEAKGLADTAAGSPPPAGSPSGGMAQGATPRPGSSPSDMPPSGRPS